MTKLVLLIIRVFKTRFIIPYQIRNRIKSTNESPETWDSKLFREKVVTFTNTLRLAGRFEYKYSKACEKPTLYASVYACMTLSLVKALDQNSREDKEDWCRYFDTFQSASDGLFYDPTVDSELYRKSDWWGARHLALHMISGYGDLGHKPKYPFSFLRPYYDSAYIRDWLDDFDWDGVVGLEDDIDNKIMNIGCLLQYQRDTWSDKGAGLAVAYLQGYLSKKINQNTGMWGPKYDMTDPKQRSRAVQFAYHLYPLFLYDKISIPHLQNAISHVLNTQNIVGGFGVSLNSSACEDIDSIDILIRSSYWFPQFKREIDLALRKSFRWVVNNQMEDGGFVFRLKESFVYGHPEMTGRQSQGALFPTWFRCLSLAYLAKYFRIDGFRINSAPGYVFNFEC